MLARGRCMPWALGTRLCTKTRTWHLGSCKHPLSPCMCMHVWHWSRCVPWAGAWCAVEPCLVLVRVHPMYTNTTHAAPWHVGGRGVPCMHACAAPSIQSMPVLTCLALCICGYARSTLRRDQTPPHPVPVWRVRTTLPQHAAPAGLHAHGKHGTWAPGERPAPRRTPHVRHRLTPNKEAYKIKLCRATFILYGVFRFQVCAHASAKRATHTPLQYSALCLVLFSPNFFLDL